MPPLRNSYLPAYLKAQFRASEPPRTIHGFQESDTGWNWAHSSAATGPSFPRCGAPDLRSFRAALIFSSTAKSKAGLGNSSGSPPSSTHVRLQPTSAFNPRPPSTHDSLHPTSFFNLRPPPTHDRLQPTSSFSPRPHPTHVRLRPTSAFDPRPQSHDSFHHGPATAFATTMTHLLSERSFEAPFITISLLNSWIQNHKPKFTASAAASKGWLHRAGYGHILGVQHSLLDIGSQSRVLCIRHRNQQRSSAVNSPPWHHWTQRYPLQYTTNFHVMNEDFNAPLASIDKDGFGSYRDKVSMMENAKKIREGLMPFNPPGFDVLNYQLPEAILNSQPGINHYAPSGSQYAAFEHQVPRNYPVPTGPTGTRVERPNASELVQTAGGNLASVAQPRRQWTGSGRSSNNRARNRSPSDALGPTSSTGTGVEPPYGSEPVSTAGGDLTSVAYHWCWWTGPGRLSNILAPVSSAVNGFVSSPRTTRGFSGYFIGPGRQSEYGQA
ncbi:hypothetical protein BU16DRAFT_568250 [Lophium mytilinum]|uniref:Uncharacterized protein n=1 Tax=Lophium mytilinum TaxID=390894 RepID=A0A6A6Q8J5_9PEZI|nr:hypothetical protein BU16DRAFT_568250 [Lophium mytilinum]